MIFTFEKLEDNNEQQHTFVATDDDTNTDYEIKFTLVSFHFLYNIPKIYFSRINSFQIIHWVFKLSISSTVKILRVSTVQCLLNTI